MKKFEIKVPASTANLGPGFDVLGAGLKLYLVLKVEEAGETVISYTKGDKVSLEPSRNYIYKIAQYVANVYHRSLPHFRLTVTNDIPLGRGLGSSGSAIVGGILLASELLELNLTREEVLDYACLIEGHPDNVSGSVYGHLTCSVMTAKVDGFDDSFLEPGAIVKKPTDYAPKLTLSTLLRVQKDIKCVVGIPAFEVLTSDARKVLPSSYQRSDLVFNLGRASTLILALQNETINPHVIHECMKDQIHQNYRSSLVPGLTKILALGPDQVDGLLGICLSGAGPTVLALGNKNFDKIGKLLVDIFADELGKDQQPIEATYMVLDFDYDGSIVTYV